MTLYHNLESRLKKNGNQWQDNMKLQKEKEDMALQMYLHKHYNHNNNNKALSH